jgi:flavorubredoxin
MAPFVASAIASLRGKSGKKIALFGSYGWGDGEWMRSWRTSLESAGAELSGDGLTVRETPDGASADECIAFGRSIAL